MHPARLLLALITLLSVISLSRTTLRAQQQPTDLNNLGQRASGTLQVGIGTTFELDIENLGPEPALTYLAEIQIFKDQDPVFQDFVEMPLLASGESAVAAFPMTWTPDEEGTFVVRTNVMIENDINPNNNTQITEVNVARPFISIEEAIDSLLNLVIFQRSNPEAITAHYDRPPSNLDDSVTMPGTVISNWDGVLTTVEIPSYVFFVDSTPGNFWEHEADVVLIPATFNSGTPIQEIPTNSPISVDTEPFDFGPSCGANPNRVYGQRFNCTPVPDVSLSTTTNTSDWAIVITGRVIKKIDSVTIGHDVKRATDRINSGQYGPKVSKSNIDIVQGEGKQGATKQEVLDALKKIKDLKCRKVIIKYIGHGTQKGLVLKADGKDATDVMSWKDFAEALKALRAPNICIDITSCFAGSAVKPLQEAGVTGSVITSSNATRKTPQGTGSGTYWEEALEACSNDTFADLNRDAMVSNKEAATWVYTRRGENDPATRPGPQVVCLNSEVKKQNTSTRSTRRKSWEMAGTSGTLPVYVQTTCVKTRYKGASMDSTIYRTNVYVKNESSVERAARYRYEIIAICKRGKNRVGVVVKVVQPRLKARSERCIATLPPDCKGMIVRRVPTSSGIPDVDVSEDSAQVVDVLEAVTLVSSGDAFRVEHTFVDPEEEAQYIASTVAVDDHQVTTDPETFSSIGDSVTTVHVNGVIPLDSTNGVELTTTIIDDSTLGETLAFTRVLVPYEINDLDSPIEPGRYRMYSVRTGDHEISALEHSRVELDSTALAFFTSDVMLDEVVIVSDSSVGQPILVNGTGQVPSLTDVVIDGIPSVSIVHDAIDVEHVTIADGSLVLQPSLGATNVNLNGIAIYGSQGNSALTIGLPQRTMITINNLVVEGAEGLDISTVGVPGQVSCVNCEVNADGIAPIFGGEVSLVQTVGAVVTDANDAPIMNAMVFVKDRRGVIIDSMETDELGIAETDVLVASVSDVVADSRPITIELRARDGSFIVDTVREQGWTQSFFADTTEPSGVERDLTGGFAYSLAPNPVALGSSATLITDVPVTEVSIIDARGAIVQRMNVEYDTEVNISTTGLASGRYTVIVSDGRKTYPVPMVIQR